MRGLVLTLLLVAAWVPSTAEAGATCRGNGKTVPADQCAFTNMAEYMNVAYFAPVFKHFWVNPTRYGRFHSRWTGYLAYPGKPSKVLLTAKRCGNTYVTFDHRKQAWWPGPC